MTPQDVIKMVEEKEVRFVDFRFTDNRGKEQHVGVPVSAFSMDKFEDVSEEPYRVDRLLTQLRLAGVLDAVAGFVLGSFTEEASPATLLQDMLCGLGKPVLGGWPTGHGTPNRPLPMGLPVALDATAGHITLLQDFLRRA